VTAIIEAAGKEWRMLGLHAQTVRRHARIEQDAVVVGIVVVENVVVILIALPGTFGGDWRSNDPSRTTRRCDLDRRVLGSLLGLLGGRRRVNAGTAGPGEGFLMRTHTDDPIRRDLNGRERRQGGKRPATKLGRLN
jgi:hypothetical protein